MAPEAAPLAPGEGEIREKNCPRLSACWARLPALFKGSVLGGAVGAVGVAGVELTDVFGGAVYQSVADYFDGPLPGAHVVLDLAIFAVSAFVGLAVGGACEPHRCCRQQQDFEPLP